MWRLLLAGLGACTADAPPTLLPACPACGPGEVAHALVLPGRARDATLDVRTGGFAVVAGDRMYLVDDDLAVAADARFADGTTLAVASRGDDSYVLQAFGSAMPARTLFAVDAVGQVRWDFAYTSRAAAPQLLADRFGPYVTRGTKVDAFDGDGHLRTAFAAAGALGVMTDGGLLTANDLGDQSEIAATFPTGPTRWARTWRGAGVSIGGAAAGASGSVAVVGVVAGNLELDGGAVAPTTGGTVVAMYSHEGALRWVTVLDGVALDPVVAITSDDRVVIGGELEAAAFGLPPPDARDAFVAVVDATGLVRSAAIGGAGDQAIRSLRPGPAGAIVFAATGAELVIGGRTLASGSTARDVVVEMVP